MKNQMSPKMDEFIGKVDQLCREYGYEIWPTDKINARSEDGTYPTFTNIKLSDVLYTLVCVVRFHVFFPLLMFVFVFVPIMFLLGIRKPIDVWRKFAEMIVFNIKD